MAKISAPKSAQNVAFTSLRINVAKDTYVNAQGVELKLNVTNASGFPAFRLPSGSRVIGGSITTVSAPTGASTFTLQLKDELNPSQTPFGAAIDVKDVGIKPIPASTLVMGGQHILLVPTVIGSTSVGEFVIDLMFVREGRAELNIN